MKKFILSIITILFMLSSHATNYYCNGDNVGCYGYATSSCWSPSYPGLTVGAGDSVFLKGNVIINNLNLTVDGVLVLEFGWNGYATAPYLLGNSSITVNTGGTMLVKTNMEMRNTSSINLYGNLFVANSPLNFETIYLLDTSSIVIQPSGLLYVEDSIYVGDFSTMTSYITVNGTLTNDGTIYNNGNIYGTGTIQTSSSSNNGNIVGGGYVAPGLSPGDLKLNFDYIMDATGTLKMELAGLSPGSQHDVLSGSGSKTLGGKLRVILYNGYIPNNNDEFTIITGDTIIGNFNTIEYPTLSANSTWSITYGASDVKVKVNTPTATTSLTANNELTITPNPSYGSITLHGDFGEGNSYHIYSLMGQKVQEGRLNKQKIISLKEGTKGLFYIEILNNQHRVFKSSFMVN